MTVGPHVFGDDRLGLWIVNLAALPDRLPKIRAALGGTITDLFLPHSCTREQLDSVRAAGFVGAHLWAATDGLTAGEYVSRWRSTIARLRFNGACELNIELSSDAALEPYMRTVVGGLRGSYPQRRLRLNVAARKAPFLPVNLLETDPHLYVTEQAAFDSPERSMAALYSFADVMLELLDYGVPAFKASVCYPAACTVGGITGSQRVNTIPLGWKLRRGVIFQDDLMSDAGLL